MSETPHYYRFFGRYFTSSDMVLAVAALFFPPLSVFLQKGCSAELFISVVLSLMGHIPGLCYSLYLVWDSRRVDPEYVPVSGDLEQGNIHIVQPEPAPQPETTSHSSGQRLGSGRSTPQTNLHPAVGSSDAPIQPPTYEEATDNRDVPQTGDFKIQR